EVDDQSNVLHELPAKNIDTGSSLERVATVLQDVDNIFETDLLRPLLEVAESLAGRRHGEDPSVDVSLKVIAEHGRATSFLIADGVLPSNEGRGYVLRRMLRRVVSHARRLGIERMVMEPLIEMTVERFGDAYPELVENRSYVLQVAGSEEERFAGTLRQGMALFETEAGRVDKGSTLPGDIVFKLHDTFGFPRELTRELAEETGLAVDEERFDVLMAEQKDRAKRAAKKRRIGEELAEMASTAATDFVGYESLEADGRVLGLRSGDGSRELAGEGEEVLLV